MKKIVILLTGLLLLSGFVMAQAKDDSDVFQTRAALQPAVLIYLPYSPAITERAFYDYLSKASKKDQTEAKGYLLSANTSLAKSNISKADMHFFVSTNDNQNKNVSVIYLKLITASQNEFAEESTIVYLDRQAAKDYLDNLAVAIKPYAAALQLKLQEKNLAVSQAKHRSLTEDGTKLETKRKSINFQISENENDKRENGLVRAKAKNDRKLNENLLALVVLNKDIAHQVAALALLGK